MVAFINGFDVRHSPQNRARLRQFMQESWGETYPEQVGDKVTSAMIATLADESLGGILPFNGEKVMVAMEEDRLTASCVYATRHGTMYIWGCYVRQSAQRAGIGRKMIERIINEGADQNCLQVTVLQVSKGAVRFYQRLGFLTVGTENFELVPGYFEPALTMKIRVGERSINSPVPSRFQQ